MSNYSIREIESLSGIKAHTLRIWEQRYNILVPKRTDTNFRFYDDVDLKLILNISLLNSNGFKISKIAEMKMEEMANEVFLITDKNQKFPEQVHALTICMIDFDEERFEKIISKNISQFGFIKTMINLVFPFLNKIGILWIAGSINPSQEHFISNLIRQKLLVAIDGQVTNFIDSPKKILLYLPEGEMHEIGLLFAFYLTKSSNFKTLYLGVNLPFLDLSSAVDVFKPDYIFSCFTSSLPSMNLQDYINKISSSFEQTKILITGHQVFGQDLELPQNVISFSKIEYFIDYLNSINK